MSISFRGSVTRSVLFALAATLLLAQAPVSAAPTGPPLATVDAQLTRLAANHSEAAEVVLLGTSHGGRSLSALHIGDRGGNVSEANETGVLLLAALHGNEQVGTRILLALAERLLAEYPANASLAETIDATDLWLVAVANPDGYVNATRKNGRDTDGDANYTRHNDGVDLNRNFGCHWGSDAHSSRDPTWSTYIGPAPFSEPETRALRELVTGRNLSYSVSYHSGFLPPVILHPWGWTDGEAAPDHALMERTAENLSAFNGYGWGQASDANLGSYPARGDSEDWLYANHSVLSFTIEAREAANASEVEDNVAALLWLLQKPPPILESAQIPEPLLPDVEYMNISYPQEAIAGQAVTLNATLALSGDWPVPPTVALEIDGRPFGDITLETASGFANASFTWTAIDPGLHNLTLIIDPHDAVAEEDEGNNRFALTVLVVSPPSEAEPTDDEAPLLGPGFSALGALLAVVAGCRREYW